VVELSVLSPMRKFKLALMLSLDAFSVAAVVTVMFLFSPSVSCSSVIKNFHLIDSECGSFYSIMIENPAEVSCAFD
jgi:hypothetical protein